MDTAGATGGSGSVTIGTGDNVIGQVKITDGTDVADVLDLAAANGLAVAILDATGAQITSFGGGTQYTEGDTDASITGTAAMMEGAGNTLLPIQGTIADGLLVNLGINNDITVASLPLPTGASTAALQLPDGHNVTIDNAAGAAAVNIQDGGNTITVDGTVTTAPPANASTNLTQVSGVAVTLGQKAMTASIPVVLASDQEFSSGTFKLIGDNIGSILPETEEANTHLTNIEAALESAITGTTTTVADTATSTTLLAAGTRKGASIVNDSSAVLYVRCEAAAASATAYSVRLVQHAYWETPFGYQGEIRGIWATDPGDGAARITEYV